MIHDVQRGSTGTGRTEIQTVQYRNFWIERTRTASKFRGVGTGIRDLRAEEVVHGLGLRVDQVEAAALRISAGDQPLALRHLHEILGSLHPAHETQSTR